MQNNLLESLKDIKAIVLDVDGVLTDGKVMMDLAGNQLRSFHVRDGFAIKAAQSYYRMAIITGGNDDSIKKRMDYLGINDVFLGVRDKVSVLSKWAASNQIDKASILGIGDDLPDLDWLQHCGIAMCPKDAVSEIKNIADYILLNNGGNACVREAIELVMKANNQWEFKSNPTSS